MEKKICNVCNNELPLTEFYKDSSKPKGFRNDCIDCNKKKKQKYYQKNKDKIILSTKEYREQNRGKIKERDKKYYEINKESYAKKAKLYREQNRGKIKEKDKKYYEINKDRILKKYHLNRETELIKMKNWKKENRVKLAEYQRNYYAIRKKNDFVFKMRINVSQLIRQSFKNAGFSKDSKTKNILGCSYDEFKQHLESQFESWMGWGNYGLYNGQAEYGWDIDHIIPLKTAKTVEDIIRLNHYTNLQPLCSYVNRDVKKANLI